MEIQQAQVRAKLKARREPYWRLIERGFSIGFRKSAGGGTWIARWRDPDSGRQHYKPLGSATDCDYADAAAEAAKWHAQCAQGIVRAETVKAALAAYVEDRRQAKGDETANDAETYFGSLIYGDDAPAWGRTFGNARLDELRVVDVRKFRDALVADGTRTKGTANRIMRRVKAALNFAYRNQMAPNDQAWRSVPTFPAADGARDLYLTLGQRRAILKQCSPALSDFLTAILYTASRPGDLAAAKVADYDGKQKTLRLVSLKGRDGTPRVRHVDLTDEAAQLFSRHARLRMKNLPLLVNEHGRPWLKHHWSKTLRAAVAAANDAGADLPGGIVAYTFRHCAITDWLRAGVNVGDVAKQAGTSIQEINKHYYQPGDTRQIRASIKVV